MQVRKSGKFKKDVIYYTDGLVNKYFRLGKQNLFSLYCLLKKEYHSGHFFSCSAPQWFEGSQSTFYRHLSEMQELGMIRKEHGTFTLVSLKKLSGNHNYKRFFPNSHVMVKKSVQQLINYWQDETVKRNYKRQLKNVVLDELGYNNNDLIVSKEKRKRYRKTYSLYLDSKRALRFISFSQDNKTSLGCIGCGNLFGKSSWYGWSVMKRLIAEKKIVRRLYYVPFFINYTTETLPGLIRHYAKLGVVFRKGRFEKVITCFAWIRDIEAKEKMTTTKAIIWLVRESNKDGLETILKQDNKVIENMYI